jgi:hypothetical protein
MAEVVLTQVLGKERAVYFRSRKDAVAQGLR